MLKNNAMAETDEDNKRLENEQLLIISRVFGIKMSNKTKCHLIVENI